MKKTNTGTKEKYNAYSGMTEKFIKMIEDGNSPWQKPWKSFGSKLPVNAVTGKPYKGINAINLSFWTQDGDPRFATRKQAEGQGWTIKEKAIPLDVYFFRDVNEKKNPKTMSTVAEVPDASGGVPASSEKEEAPEREGKKRLVMWTYRVYAASDIEGIPPLPAPKVTGDAETNNDFAKSELLDRIVSGMGVPIKYGGSVASYTPSTDEIHMPPKSTFKSWQGHDCTLLHEEIHASGADSRLKRGLVTNRNSPEYAREELVAELGSVMVSQVIGIPLSEDHLKNHASYLSSWLEVMKEDPKFLYRSSVEASKAVAFLMEKGNIPMPGMEAKGESVSSTPEKTVSEPESAFTEDEDEMIPVF